MTNPPGHRKILSKKAKEAQGGVWSLKANLRSEIGRFGGGRKILSKKAKEAQAKNEAYRKQLVAKGMAPPGAPVPSTFLFLTGRVL